MAKKGNLKAFQEKELEERPVRVRRYKYLFLIVCEDENTEPTYFTHFKEQIPKGTLFLKTIGTGRDAKGVVEQAIKEKGMSFQMKQTKMLMKYGLFLTKTTHTKMQLQSRDLKRHLK